MLRKPFQKLVRLRFLQPDGSVAFMLDNRIKGPNAGAFISDGSISYNWQNGRRASASVTLDNVDGAYDYSFNTIWFGQEIALDEGLILSDGVTEYYIQQGVFLIDSPTENVQPGQRTVQYSLVDKAAALDGTLGGNLEATHQVDVGTNIFTPIAALLSEDRGNGYPVDRVKPVFTEYYNNRTQQLPDGTTVSMVLAPYTLTIDSTDGTIWDVVSGLAAMVNGWVGYDETGALRIDPSQDDILDSDKPILWDFSMQEAELLGMTYSVKNTEVYNDYIVIGEALTDGTQPSGRVQVLDPRSPVDIHAIGRKTKRISQVGFGTVQQCQDYASWLVKHSAVLQRAVSISCSQILHIRGNELVTITRTDKEGSPTERHLVQGFSRPLASTGAMTISAVSVNDFPITTIAYVGSISFVPSQIGGLAYTGSAESPTWQNYDPHKLIIGGTTSATNVGTYTASFTPIGGYVWWDNTTDEKYATWTITKQPLTIPTVTSQYTYDGTAQALIFTGFDSSTMNKGGTYSATNAGNYTATVSLKNTTNYMWADGTITAKSYPWKILKRTLTAPTVIGTYTYTGSAQTVAFANFDSNTMTKGGTLTATNAGSYTATISINDTANNQWPGGSTAARGYGWSIQKAAPAYTAPTAKSLTYTGSAQALLNAGSTSNGTIQYSANNSTWSTSIPTQTNAGTYTVYWRLVGDANHKDIPSTAINVTIAKATPATPTLSKNTISFTDVGSDTFVVTRSGDGAVTATSSNTNIATVSVSGTVVTVKTSSNAGSATITVKVGAGTNYNAYTGSGAQCAVTVAISNANCITFSRTGTITLAVANSQKTWNGTLEWSNGTNMWTVWDGTTTLVGSGGTLYLRGRSNSTLTTGSSNNYFVMSGTGISCSGNIESLLDYPTVAAGQHPAMVGYCFQYLFKDCVGLVSAPTLGSVNLTYCCYYCMFMGCVSLTTAPSLPATDLSNAEWCYANMFRGCSSLTAPPALPATTLSSHCYYSMFYECAAITTIANLPATTLQDTCYSFMYGRCAGVKMSASNTGSYTYSFRIPKTGTGTTASNALEYMFVTTGGTFTGTPSINTTYYTTAQPVG